MSDFLGTNYDPYEVLLELQNTTEQLTYQLNHATEVINDQAKLIQQMSRFLMLVDKRMAKIEAYIREVKNEK